MLLLIHEVGLGSDEFKRVFDLLLMQVKNPGVRDRA
jgi:hypothetical protein